MKAVIVREFRPFAEAEIGEADDLAPAAGEVLVDLHASDVNFPDILFMEGRYQALPALPFSPGMGATGRVAALGAGVHGFAPGQRVLILPSHGTYAEKAVAPATACFPMPDDVPFDIGAALGLVYQTAWFSLIDRGGFREGDRVLVLGATGGVGMAALQLARALGAGTVIASARGDAGIAFARRHGADAVVDAGRPDLRDHLRATVMEATGGEGVDIVIDPVGGEINAAALRAIAWSGRLVVVGFASGDIPKIGGNYLLVRNIAACGIQWTDYLARQPERVQAAQQQIFSLWRDGRLAPEITARLPLERYAEALAALGETGPKGKMILTIQNAGE